MFCTHVYFTVGTSIANISKPLSSSNDDTSPLSQLEMLSLVRSSSRLFPENDKSIQAHQHISYERPTKWFTICERYVFLLEGKLLATFIGLPPSCFWLSLSRLRGISSWKNKLEALFYSVCPRARFLNVYMSVHNMQSFGRGALNSFPLSTYSPSIFA